MLVIDLAMEIDVGGGPLVSIFESDQPGMLDRSGKASLSGLSMNKTPQSEYYLEDETIFYNLGKCSRTKNPGSVPLLLHRDDGACVPFIHTTTKLLLVQRQCRIGS